MTIRNRLTVLVLLAVGVAADALADCTGGASLQYVRSAYAEAQAHERAGKLEDALYSYVETQARLCDGDNPLALTAAKKAAQIAKPLAAAEEMQSHFAEAARLYDMGGYYAESDRVHMANVRAHPDDPRAAVAAFEWLKDHGAPVFGASDASPAFQANHKVRLSVTGPYVQDPRLVPEIKATMAKGADRALQREAAAFNDSEEYLRERVAVIQARPEDGADFQASYAWSQQRLAPFAQKWPDNPLKKSRDELDRLAAWSSLDEGIYVATTGNLLTDVALMKRAQARAEERAAALEQRYSGAPKSLEDAIAYYEFAYSRLPNATDEQDRLRTAQGDARIRQVKAQSMKLGDAANAQGRLVLAHDYYEAAGDSAKAMAAQAKYDQLARQKLQPAIDEATKQGQALAAGFGSPAQIEAMKKQAQEAARAMKAQPPPNKTDRAKKADDLSKELGL
jgi:hypothetical protein